MYCGFAIIGAFSSVSWSGKLKISNKQKTQTETTKIAGIGWSIIFELLIF